MQLGPHTSSIFSVAVYVFASCGAGSVAAFASQPQTVAVRASAATIILIVPPSSRSPMDCTVFGRFRGGRIRRRRTFAEELLEHCDVAQRGWERKHPARLEHQVQPAAPVPFRAVDLRPRDPFLAVQAPDDKE